MTGVGTRTPRRGRLWLWVAVAVLLTTTFAAPVGQAQAQEAQLDEKIEDARERAERLDEKAAQAKKRREAAEREFRRLQGEVAAAHQRLQAAQERVAEAEAAAEEARRRLRRAERALEATRRKLEAKKDELATVVRESYMYGTQAMEPMLGALETLAGAEDPNELADSLHVLELSMGDQAGLVEEAKRLVARFARLRDEAARARQRREDRLDAAEAAGDRAAAVHARMQQLVTEADTALRRRATTVVEVERQLDETRESLLGLHEARATSMYSAPGDLVTVEGITVAASLGPDLRALLRDARADGIHLGGSGYRSPETTARLRIANGCPDVHSSPSSACDVPTARPGSSMHERGLAIDFSYQGRTICFPDSPSACHGNPGFDWLTRNAHRYGLQVLSSEAWHWSVNGQ